MGLQTAQEVGRDRGRKEEVLVGRGQEEKGGRRGRTGKRRKMGKRSITTFGAEGGFPGAGGGAVGQQEVEKRRRRRWRGRRRSVIVPGGACPPPSPRMSAVSWSVRGLGDYNTVSLH